MKKMLLHCTSLAAMAAFLATSQAATVYQNAVLADNPLVYWTFDEAGDTDPASSLVNNEAANDLTASGGATRAASTTTAGGADLGRAASFDGGAATRFAAADLSDTSLPTTGISQFAMEFWFKPNATSAQYLMETFTEAGVANESSLIYGFNAGQLEIFSGDRAGPVIGNTTSWHHAVFAHYGGGDLEVFIDGASTAVVGAYNSTQAFGRFALGHTVLATTNGFNGLIDEFAIYDLTGLADDAARKAHAADIATHYNLVPEPSVGLLFGLGAIGLVVARRRR